MNKIERIKIKEVMSQKNIRQSNMARQLDMTRQCLCDILSGRLKGYKYRRRISQYLGVAEEILFPEDGDNNIQSSCQIQKH